MTEQNAVAIMNNLLFTMENTLKYREDKGESVDVSEWMIPEAMRIVLDIAMGKGDNSVLNAVLRQGKGAEIKKYCKRS